MICYYFFFFSLLTQKQISLVNIFLFLRLHQETLESHAGINAFHFQRLVCPLPSFIKFIENNVPNFYAIYVNFRRRTAGSFFARGSPEIIFAFVLADFYVRINTLPNRSGLLIRRNAALIVAKNGNIIYFETQLFGNKIITVLYCLLFPITSKAKITKHFQKSDMRVIAHFIDISSANTFLRSGNIFCTKIF